MALNWIINLSDTAFIHGEICQNKKIAVDTAFYNSENPLSNFFLEKWFHLLKRTALNMFKNNTSADTAFFRGRADW